MKPKTIILLIALVLFLFVLLQNIDSIPLELFFWDMHIPLVVLIVSTLLIGWAAGWSTRLAYEKGKNTGAKPAPQKSTENDPPDVPQT